MRINQRLDLQSIGQVLTDLKRGLIVKRLGPGMGSGMGIERYPKSQEMTV